MPTSRSLLALVLVANALLRIANGASGVLVGLYLAALPDYGEGAGAVLAGMLGAVVFGAELVFAAPAGVAADAMSPRELMSAGALLAAAGTQLFGMTASAGIFFLSRSLEGAGAAACTPALLAHLTDITDRNPSLRARVMSYFEISLLAGLAFGGLLGGQSWGWFGPAAFSTLAGLYLMCAILFHFGARNTHGFGAKLAVTGFRSALQSKPLQRLAPIWLCVNAIVGLWLGPTLIFLLSAAPPSQNGQFLPGLFSAEPKQVGWVMLLYAVVFAIGVLLWSIFLPKLHPVRVLKISLWAMFAACFGFYAFNHAPAEWRGGIAAATIVAIMVESGFTPAALSLLASVVGAEPGRGSAMGIYSFLLSMGAIIGSLLAGWLGSLFSIDGLIYGTVAMATIALIWMNGFGGATSESEL